MGNVAIGFLLTLVVVAMIRNIERNDRWENHSIRRNNLPADDNEQINRTNSRQISLFIFKDKRRCTE